MAITYTWSIPQMNAYIEFEEKENVIYTVHYIYKGSKESNGVVYSDQLIGTQSYTYTKGDDFIPYEDTEEFENVVIGWLEDSLNVEELQAVISKNIESQITPVTEDLYFTWQ